MPEDLYIPIDLGTDYVPKLPLSSKRETLNFISGETLVDLMINQVPLIIVDCWFDYEFEGGHIDGAININNPENLE